MPQRSGLRQIGGRSAGVPYLGSGHQRCRDGHAQVETASRFVALYRNVSLYENWFVI